MAVTIPMGRRYELWCRHKRKSVEAQLEVDKKDAGSAYAFWLAERWGVFWDLHGFPEALREPSNSSFESWLEIWVGLLLLEPVGADFLGTRVIGLMECPVWTNGVLEYTFTSPSGAFIAHRIGWYAKETP